MEPLGKHILVEYSGCDPATLNDDVALEELLYRAAEAAGATAVGYRSHRLYPEGFACILVLQESHLSIRSSPAVANASADFFTCGDCDPILAHQVMIDGLDAQSFEIVEIERGLPTMPSMRVIGYRPTKRIEIDCTSSSLPATVCVKPSPGKGLGLFASRSFKCGDPIYETVVNLDSFDNVYVLKTDVGESVLSADEIGTELTVPVLMAFSEDMRIDLAAYYGLQNPAPSKLRDYMTSRGTREVLVTGFDGLMNHSRQNNIRVDWPEGCLSFVDDRPQWTIRIVASDDIEAGKELFWDYTEAPGVFVPSDWQS